MATKSRQRINITLADDTLRLLDQVAARGSRSRLIDEAVRFFVQSKGRTKLDRLLREGAKKRTVQDRALAEEWFTLDGPP